MDSTTLESFINFCDDMTIAEENILRNVKTCLRKKDNAPTEKKNNDTDKFTFSLKKANGSMFDALYDKEVYCAEGMSDASSDKTAKIICDYFSKKPGCARHINMYYCSGKDLNTYYHLTGDNAYDDDLGIFFIDWSNFGSNFDAAENKGKFRYFSDVVDNNAGREIQKGNPYYKNYHSKYGND